MGEVEKHLTALSLLDAIVTALKNGHEGMFSYNWDQDDAAAGFWILQEDYERLRSAIAKATGERSPVVSGKE